MAQRQFALTDRLGRVPQRLGDVLGLEVWKVVKDLGYRHAVGNHRDDSRYRHAKAPDTGQATHDIRIGRDPLEHHGFEVTGVGWCWLQFCRSRPSDVGGRPE